MTPSAAAVDARLLPWFERAHRDMPWRRTRDPYAIWVSEVMLQQTRVETVIPYYEAFLARFPSLAALASAPLADVLKAWEGMGYYARARNLHRAARLLVERGSGLPDTLEELAGLPGIGRYTAGAVLSIAYGRSLPALDGNVRRVLCRLFAEAGDPRQGATMRRLWDRATSLMGGADPSLHNQALIELGAIVCTPSAPDCAACPLATMCAAHGEGDPTAYPRKSPRRAVPHQDVAVAVIRRRGRYLMTQRPVQGMLGGLWEFPGRPRDRAETLQEACRRGMREALGIDVAVGASLPVVHHTFTHLKVSLHPFECALHQGQPQPLGYDAIRWIRLDDVGELALPAAQHRILAAVVASR